VCVLAAAAEIQTLAQVLVRGVADGPTEPALSWIDDDGKYANTWTRAELGQRASAVAMLLQNAGVVPGDTVVLVYSPGIDFDAALWGCALARVIAVPVYPPDPSNLAKSLPNFTQIVKDCGARVALSTAAYQNLVSLAKLRRTLSFQGASNSLRKLTRSLSVDAENSAGASPTARSPTAAQNETWPMLQWINTVRPVFLPLRSRPPE
jgi:acyl-CoA synthetase (AMP-forming)/AMP-acid ligase II